MIKRGLWRTSSNILAPVVLSTVVLIATAAANGAQARSPIPPWCAWLLRPSAVHAAAWGQWPSVCAQFTCVLWGSAAAPALAIIAQWFSIQTS